jgi:hypothetical protein
MNRSIPPRDARSRSNLRFPISKFAQSISQFGSRATSNLEKRYHVTVPATVCGKKRLRDDRRESLERNVSPKEACDYIPGERTFTSDPVSD